MSDYDDPELRAAAAAAARSRKSDKRWKMLLTVLSLLLGVVTVVAFWLSMNNARLASENATFAQQQQGEKKEIAKEAGKALCGEGDRQIYDRDLCAKWAEAAGEPTIAPSAPPVPIGGPSQADLVEAFRAYCAGGNCKGRDGQPPTPDDIAAAFVRFCSDGRCTGPAGQDAAPPKDGKDGTDGVSLPPAPEVVLAAVQTVCANDACRGPAGADGKEGPPPTAEAILAAVQQVCANDACRGPAGADGQTGATGPAPASFTFTDRTGTTYTCTPNPPGSATYTCEGSTPGVLP
ncbi:hypothetical protein [Arthrobacter sp. ISL-72]|uniref:hypothetical protein n=1 Tax=Arthrobacter sp. ISL-72 TaxID=2819114 RepID=UPI001BEA84DC|nr:hypothetical protein [Arthrobacter sp. ISL-72]MBT2594724.1 hypothetical protein [Arthrobacter sp. ISL-72]